ncbi:MAG: hypothetical protein HZY75_14025 [Nocardioidaceae bacterium]|nr:MAG: hypothetical protein HZY75_14025 [Nocardioidaceae bacterium]
MASTGELRTQFVPAGQERLDGQSDQTAHRAVGQPSSVQGTLALELSPSATPDVRVPLPRSRVATTQERELRAWAARFTTAVFEALSGDRPVSQLLRWTSPVVYRQLDRRSKAMGSRGLDRIGSSRAQVRSVHIFQPGPHKAEVSVHVRIANRSQAVAARIERADGRWVCTALEL